MKIRGDSSGSDPFNYLFIMKWLKLNHSDPFNADPFNDLFHLFMDQSSLTPLIREHIILKLLRGYLNLLKSPNIVSILWE